jgi:chromosome segregation ATPase
VKKENLELKEKSKQMKSEVAKSKITHNLCHDKLQEKDEIIEQLRSSLHSLKDEMSLTNENINQIKRNALIIKTEDESLAELSNEMIVLLNDCHSKTSMTEDRHGNFTIGKLTFRIDMAGKNRISEVEKPGSHDQLSS